MAKKKGYLKRKKAAMKHPDVPGAGAKKRKKLRGQEKVGVVLSEFKRGTLHTGGSGNIVTDPQQAKAIALSEAGLARKKLKKRRRSS